LVSTFELNEILDTLAFIEANAGEFAFAQAIL
jgi:hypothetical protein